MSRVPLRILPALPALLITFALVACDEALAPTQPADALALAHEASLSVANAGATRYTFTANGDFAFADWWESDRESFGYGRVAVHRIGSGPSAVAFLDYYAERCRVVDPEWWDIRCELVAAGWGRIPAADVSGGARSSLRLDTDIAGNPDFQVIAGDAGPVRITWQRTPYFQQEIEGRRAYRAGSFSESRNGPELQASASAAGNIGAFALPHEGWALVGWTRGVVTVSGGR